jgi:predicted DNA binding protein
LQGNSKLTEKDVKEIRKCYKRGDKQCGMNALAKKYGVSLSVINKVIGRRTYKNVE